MPAEELDLPRVNWGCRNCGNEDRRVCRCAYDPMRGYAHANPQAFVSGYLEGWHQALQMAKLTGLFQAPTPAIQASPTWIAGQLLRESITPMVVREMPWVDERFFGEDEP